MNLLGHKNSNMDLPKENICADAVPLDNNIRLELDVEPPKVQDVTSKNQMMDPAALLRQKTWKLFSHIMDASLCSYALSTATVLTIPLMQCMDEGCMENNFPAHICDIWYTQIVVVITVIILNLLLAAFACAKSKLVKTFRMLSYTLLMCYYVLGFVLYIALQPYDTHLALHMFGTTCAVTLPSLIMNRAMAKKPKVKVVYVTQA